MARLYLVPDIFKKCGVCQRLNMPSFLLKSSQSTRSGDNTSWSWHLGNTLAQSDRPSRVWLALLRMPSPDITVPNRPVGLVTVGAGPSKVIPDPLYARLGEDYASWLTETYTQFAVEYNTASHRLVFTPTVTTAMTLNDEAAATLGFRNTVVNLVAGQVTTADAPVRTGARYDDLVVESNVSKGVFMSQSGGQVGSASLLGVAHSGDLQRSYTYVDDVGQISVPLHAHEALQNLTIGFRTLDGFQVKVNSEFFLLLRQE